MSPPRSAAQKTAAKDEVIQIRAPRQAKVLFGQAAALRGQKLSEFMLDCAYRQAEATLLDQRTFFVDEEAHARFLALLDAPPAISTDAVRRLQRKAPWEA
ncbi:type II toxin-antitoxin system TacA family antitoxin [Thauera sp. Sel9]|uniref:type II toxin-antitoxin system TacA family antitoxin n=1 Tax=Thauera sp. Sel9 TaxID=2974299 RepID=UPI0021E127F9|nr:DUF1778 domain-containing protein [Thauera sp. Sel9]MCV2217711.1 DUF1778 domain-containing protein [Thauera sp. Sel9]